MGRETGEPVHNALNWQDTRTDHLVHELGGEHGADRFRDRCGLPLATYFSGPKIRWLLDHVDGLAERAEAGDVLFGTMDSWLIWKLCGRHLTDVTNAGRTMLMNLETLDWDDVLLDAMGVPRAMLPEIRPSMEVYGEAGGALAGLPVAAALGDQHAALFGQTCFEPGDAKCTYGTGSFLLMNTGEQPVRSANGLLTTVGYKIGDEPATYALEGSIAVTGALVQWFRDKIGLIGSASEIETLARTVDDNGGCYFVPAFSGLFAPHWRSDARGVIAGLTGYISKGHLARAVLEATAWQTREVVDAMNSDAGVELTSLKVDGGMTANNLLMQSLADVLDVPVVRPIVAETPSLGAAYAGRARGRLLVRRRRAARAVAQGRRVAPGDGADRARQALPQVAQGGRAHGRLGRRGRRLTADSAERLRGRPRAAGATTSRPGPGGRRCAGRGSSRGPCAPRAGSSPSCPPPPRRPSAAARRRAARRPPRRRAAPRPPAAARRSSSCPRAPPCRAPGRP